MPQEEQDVTTAQEKQTEQDSNESESYQEPQKSSDEAEKNKEIPRYADKLMRLYPQYEELWITPQGFVHPVGAPKRILKCATLYKNKYYKK